MRGEAQRRVGSRAGPLPPNLLLRGNRPFLGLPISFLGRLENSMQSQAHPIKIVRQALDARSIEVIEDLISFELINLDPLYRLLKAR